MSDELTTILNKYNEMGLYIHIDAILSPYVSGLKVWGRWDNLFFSYMYDSQIVIGVFHADIEAILCDFKIKFENEKRRWENENV